jgi:NAD(P)-dependent dehydrogenase (short-subunit alcohol dehydrogenase family)
MTQKENKKTAIVTGGGRGIGRETAITLAKRGVNVVVCSRTENDINSVVYEIKRIVDTAEVVGVKCDVGRASQVISTVKLAVDKFGWETINVLVNNAGVAFNKKLIETSEREWDQTINTNLKGAYLFTKAVLPIMIKRRSGSIVNVNSGAGRTGLSNLSSYCASKFGLFGLTESVALEANAYNLRVMTILLGQVATQMWQQFDSSYFENNKKRMLDPRTLQEK